MAGGGAARGGESGGGVGEIERVGRSIGGSRMQFDAVTVNQGDGFGEVGIGRGVEEGGQGYSREIAGWREREVCSRGRRLLRARLCEREFVRVTLFSGLLYGAVELT